MPLGIFVPAQLNDLAVDVAVGTPAQGAVLYRGSSKWNSLAAGSNGQVLTSAGAAANPSWTTLPTDTDTLATLTDVSLSGTTQGQILYRGASAWNNLGVGTSGQFLQTQGAAANPVWATLPTTITGDVTLAPASSSRNVIQPTGDFVNLALKTQSGQTAAVIQFIRSDGALCADWVTESLAGAAVITQQMSSANMFFQGNSSLNSLVIRNFEAVEFQSKFSMGNFPITWNPAAVHTAKITVPSGIDDNFLHLRTPIDGGLQLEQNDNSANSSVVDQWVISTTTLRQVGRIGASWATATDASRKGRLTVSAYDTAARECLRLEASGSAALIGFLGAAAVVRQTLGNAATDAATTQTLANNLRTTLINLGLGQT